MSILSEFERRLEGMIEGLFTKAFRSGLQPVELANRILREMDANKTVGLHQVWVPNAYVFWLSEGDRERFRGTERALRRELEQVVREGAAERGCALVGPAEVEFQTDQSLKQGEFSCEAILVEGQTGPDHPVDGAPPKSGKTPPRVDTVEPEPEEAELVLIEKGKPGKVYPIAKDVVVIGRLADSDIVLADPGASRRHAEVRRQDRRFVLADLGSTNGTMVNEATIGERELAEGDRITIGRTVLEFRRR